MTRDRVIFFGTAGVGGLLLGQTSNNWEQASWVDLIALTFLLIIAVWTFVEKGGHP